MPKSSSSIQRISVTCAVLAVLALNSTHHSRVAGDEADRIPEKIQGWLQPQNWQRDTVGPVLQLGNIGDFDDTHMFGPCVARLDDAWYLWYSGSSHSVANRVFHLGLATSPDGRQFEKHQSSPVFQFGDGQHSILTATLLRSPDGSVLKEDGKLRMWFSSTHFAGDSGHHALYESWSPDGVHWDKPSEPLLDHVYAPTILKEGNEYRMWYTDVSEEPWVFRLATSRDGRRWRVHPDPLLGPDAAWEKTRLFYPTVLKVDGIYLMWYGSYWTERPQTTAIGLAASLDGYRWYRNPHNPVFKPDPDRPWESHYTTSQSVIRDEDGSFRIWYASRKEPPFVNKYFALNTATWSGPIQETSSSDGKPATAAESTQWQDHQRRELKAMLGLPQEKAPLDAEKRGEVSRDGIVIEKWVYTTEQGSRTPAVLYRPVNSTGPTPGVVLTFGHGGSKSHPCYQYIGQLYAKLGIACLAADPVGEEERHLAGRMGSRAHDPRAVHQLAWDTGRPIMGKLVWDTMRGVDFLLSRNDIDPSRVGVAGNSLGGAKASWMASIDDRLSFAIVSGWSYDDIALRSKYCTRAPIQEMREQLTWPEFASLAAPHCRLLVTNGDADVVIDRDGDGSAWQGTQAAIDEANATLRNFGLAETLETWFETEGGHRPYPAHPEVVAWFLETVTLNRTSPSVEPLSFGDWCDDHNITLEPLYGTPIHLRGATVVGRGVQYLQPEKLAVLKPEERGTTQFTLSGWLNQLGGIR